MDLFLQTEQLNDIQKWFDQFKEVCANKESLNDVNKSNMKIKLNILYSNLEIIKENIIDLYSDLINKDFIINDEIKEACYQQKKIKQFAKELFPIYIKYYLENNNYIGDAAGPAGP